MAKKEPVTIGGNHEKHLVAKAAEYRSPMDHNEWYKNNFSHDKKTWREEAVMLVRGIFGLFKNNIGMMLNILIVAIVVFCGLILGEIISLRVFPARTQPVASIDNLDVASMTDTQVYDRGMDLFNQSNFQEAKKMFAEAYRRNQQDGKSLEYLALCEYNLKEYEGAQQHLLQAIAATPQNYYINNILANIYRDTGKFQLAEEYYRKAISSNPGFVSAYINLASMDLGLGSKEKAMEVIEAGLKSNPDNDDLIQYRNTLKQ